jgi:hypothetical protein
MLLHNNEHDIKRETLLVNQLEWVNDPLAVDCLADDVEPYPSVYVP